MVRRLTCDGNIDTLGLPDLVKLSYYNPKARRIILQTFTACETHELSVKQGQKVNFVYRDGDWAYISTDDKKQGFVPFNVCAKIGLPQDTTVDASFSPASKNSRKNNIEQSSGRKESIESAGTASCSSVDDYDSFTEWSNDSDADATSDATMQERGVSGMTVHNGQPLSYVRSMPYDRSPIVFEAVKATTNTQELYNDHSDQQVALLPEEWENPPSPTGIYRVLYDYEGTNVYDITVRADDIVFLLDSRDAEWLWVQLPNGKQGYVPSNYLATIDIQTSERNVQTDPSSAENYPGRQEQHTRNVQTHNTNIVEGKDKATRKIVPDTDSILKESAKTCDESPVEQLYSQVSRPRTSKSDYRKPTENAVCGSSVETRGSRRQKKTAPKKPPRTKKPAQGLSPRSVDSLDTTFDSLDTSYTESDYSRANVHAELDSMHPGHIVVDHGTGGGILLNGNKRSRGSKEKCVHKQSNRKRLPSAVFSSFEECTRGYFDEIFYEEKDQHFGQTTRRSVVNVSEILKMREKKQMELEEARENRSRKAEAEHKSRRNVPNMKQFLMELPTSKIENAKHITTNSIKSHANNKHQLSEVHSSSGIQLKHHFPESEVNAQAISKRALNFTKSETGPLNCIKHYGSTDDLRRITEQRQSLRPRCNSQGSGISRNMKTAAVGQTAERAADWSFGYPRKTKAEVNAYKHNTNLVPHRKVENLNEIVCENIDVKNTNNKRSSSCQRKFGADDEPMMSELLKHTDDLLEKTGLLLESDTDFDSDVFQSEDEIESSVYGETTGFDATDKCSWFVSNNTIGLTGLGYKDKEMENKDDNCVQCSAPANAYNQDFENGSIGKESHKEDGPVKDKKANTDQWFKSSLLDVRGITEFVSQCDYEPEADNELPMKHGEIFHVGLDGQDSDQWYWAYSPRLRKYGFVPRDNVKIPMVTII